MSNINTHHHLAANGLREKDSYGRGSVSMPPGEHPWRVGFAAHSSKPNSNMKKGLGTVRHDVVLCTSDNLGPGTGMAMYGLRMEVVSEGK